MTKRSKRNPRSVPAIPVTRLSDADLAIRMRAHTGDVLLVRDPSGWRFLLLLLDQQVVTDAVSGDLDQHSIQALTGLSRRLTWSEIPAPALSLLDQDAIDPTPLLQLTRASTNARTLRAWRNRRDRLLPGVAAAGRAPISSSTREAVYLRSCGCCEFEGCGTYLFADPLTGAAGNYGYLAHNVAAQPNGPRGNADSATLQDDASNILLLCDIHHRLVDRVDPLGYPTPRLEAMMRSHESKVRLALKSLEYEACQAIGLIGDINGQTVGESRRDMHRALFQSRLRPSTESIVDVLMGNTPGGVDSRDTDTFWAHFLSAHRTSIWGLGDAAAGNRVPLAVFPKHQMPALILAGRIVGEARPVTVFQYDRNRSSWTWPEASEAHEFDLEATAPEAGHADEMLLVIGLTAPPRSERIPKQLLALPRIDVTARNPSHSVIASPEDLARFRSASARALRIAQDEWQCREIHLIPIAPASACFALGQQMQARHHARVTIYQLAQEAFRPTLRIDRHEVRASAGEVCVPLS